MPNSLNLVPFNVIADKKSFYVLRQFFFIPNLMLQAHASQKSFAIKSSSPTLIN